MLGNVLAFLDQMDGAVKELAVKAEANGGDVSGLLVAQNIAGAPNFQVLHGDLVAGA